MKDAKYYSEFDVHLSLNTKSKLLTAMLTPEGFYMFNVLSVGLCNAGDLFDSALHDLLSGLAGETNIADDIIVFGQHRKNMMPTSSDS